MKPTNKNLAAFFAVSEKTIHNYKNGCEGKQILYEAMKEKFLKVQQNAGLKKVKFIRKFDSSFCPLKTYKVLKVCNGGKFYIVADSDGNEMDNLMHVEDCEEIKC
jgi:spore cortex formation protein SpoVR/YcgB (stage V sporulation)